MSTQPAPQPAPKKQAKDESRSKLTRALDAQSADKPKAGWNTITI